ncbi:MAG: hypothetical protein U1E60_12475 [Reyranellaceae bacterium]
MTITLPREQQEWLEAQVAAGDYDSVEQAVASIVAEHMQLDVDDLSWAKPLVDDGVASLAQGEALTLAAHRRGIEAKLASLRRR